ncbi:MAG: twitching motility protein PilT [Candidatus Cellulosilyticum pullistercoris]|uniref:Twitching motility protein PilT n=1 Tax=Candidatus Cellulosilyticum pullistercoris TaxID=2838521 RepID=A0A9E2NJ59_9FIRM|nr:twitching motility protein PilT [Candidatus Cellulosilyticum pullistercoris]
MIKIITGQTGEGKTKLMIEAANKQVNSLKGNAIYIDSNLKHRYALAHQIRLIEASAFPLESRSSFIAFLCGIIATNHDIEVVFIDELFKLTQCSIDEISAFFEEIKRLSERYQIEFVIGTACSRKDLPQHLTPYLIA